MRTIVRLWHGVGGGRTATRAPPPRSSGVVAPESGHPPRTGDKFDLTTITKDEAHLREYKEYYRVPIDSSWFDRIRRVGRRFRRRRCTIVTPSRQMEAKSVCATPNLDLEMHAAEACAGAIMASARFTTEIGFAVSTERRLPRSERHSNNVAASISIHNLQLQQGRHDSIASMRSHCKAYKRSQWCLERSRHSECVDN